MLVSVALLSHVLLEFHIVSTAPVNPRLIPVVRQELHVECYYRGIIVLSAHTRGQVHGGVGSTVLTQ